MSVTERLAVRVWVPDVWDHIEIDADPQDTVAALKERALAETTGRTLNPGDYLVKFRGALILDEHQSLASLGVPNRAPMIVLAARRRPVR